MGISDGLGPQWSEDHGWPQQPEPIKNEYPAVWDLVFRDLQSARFQNPAQERAASIVLEDMKRRDAAGAKKYGVRLQPFNGRNSIQDTYEEVLDGIVYVRSAIFENDHTSGTLITEDSEFVRVGLLKVYSQLMDSALMLAHMLEKKKQKEQSQNESLIDTGDGRNSQELRHNQSNIIIP